MELRRKLAILADAAKYDASCSSSGGRRKTPAGGLGNSEGMGICHSYTPDGRCVSLLKILLTNECVFDCQYCINRASSGVERARFTPAEVIRLTLEFYRRNYIEGLFLSSGVLRSPDATMELLIAVARGLREQHGFGGYIHLKATPGVSAELLARAGLYADRLSVNVELPTANDLRRLAPEKTHAAVDAAMGAIRERRDELFAIGLQRVCTQIEWSRNGKRCAFVSSHVGESARKTCGEPLGKITTYMRWRVGDVVAAQRRALRVRHRRRRVRIIDQALLDPLRALAKAPTQRAPNPSAGGVFAHAPRTRLFPTQRTENKIADLGAVFRTGKAMRQHPCLHSVSRRLALGFERGQNFDCRLLAGAVAHGRNPYKECCGEMMQLTPGCR